MTENIKKKRQGALNLVLLGTLTGLVACSPQPSGPQYSTKPELLNRAEYKTKEDCAADWGSETNCEPRGGGSGGGGARYFGPYYSNAGQFYGYDGKTHNMANTPQRATGVSSEMVSPSQVYKSSGQYATQASARAVSRGGFGGGGRGGFSGGG